MDSPIPEKKEYALILGLAFEKDKALQQLIPGRKRRGLSRLLGKFRVL